MLLNMTLTSYVFFILFALIVVVLKFNRANGEGIPFLASLFADASFICAVILTVSLTIAKIWGLA